MTLFIYQAMDSSGNLVKGSLEASDQIALVDMLQDRGYFPVSIEESTGEADHSQRREKSTIKLNRRRVSSKKVLDFTRELSGMLEAGLTLDKSLSILAELETNEPFRDALLDIYKSIHGGESFADSLLNYPDLFSEVYVNTVRAGEAGGSLETVLKRLKRFMEDEQVMKEEVKSAMIYPALLTLVGGTAVIMMILFVLPRFSAILDDMGGVMPLPTQILLSISEVLKGYWPLMMGGAIVLFFSMRYYLGTEEGRYKFDQFKLTLPVIGPVFEMASVSRFSRTLGTLMQGGLPILDALRIAVKTMGNVFMADKIGPVIDSVRRGKDLSHSLQEAASFPPLLIHMLSVGEETGHIDETLISLSDKFDRDIKVTLKRMLSLLEPMIIIVMAAIVGFIVISLMLAVFSFNDIPL